MNICANFDILFYLSHPRNKYAEQTLFEINTMLYLAELLSIYDGCNAQKWGYGFARNKYGAPVSIELMEEVEFLCAKGYLSKDSSGYYRISDTASLNSILSISKSGILGWRSKYIEVVFDSLLTKSFPRVVRAVQNEPGISLLESINRTSILLESSLINALYEDFGVLKEIIGDPQMFRLLCGLIICLFKSNRRISMLDRETVERLLQNNLDAKLNSELSKYGYQLDAAHKLFRFITSIFERTPPELITWKFKVIMPVGDWDFSQKIILNFHRMNEVFTSECAFIIVDSNLYLIEPYEADYSGRDHICYQYNAPQNESLTIKDKQFQLSEYYDSAITSIFAQPTYKELDEAMDYYNTRYVRDSSCAVLSQIWTDEAKREFVQKPEHFMRDSLWQCLQNILRNHTVKREQIVDATHPVDIKVTWPAINNVALIEVKWLGDSGQTQYRDARANEGAKQLIDYLASSVQEEPDKHFVGYLTVFDGRRGKTSNQYERQEINYRSEYSSHPSMNYRRFYMAECV